MKRHIFLFGLLTITILATVAIFTTEATGTVTLETATRTASIARSAGELVGSFEHRYSTAIVTGNVTWIGTTIPSGYYYHFKQVQTPYGPGCSIDSIGKPSSELNYHFLAYTNSDFLAGPNGGVEVRGYFRQNDTFPTDLQPGRRQRALYVMYSNNPNVIAVSFYVLNSSDGTGWHYKDVVIGGLTPNATVKVGVGTVDPYATDWSMEVDWTGVEVLYTSATDPFMPGPGYIPGGGTGGGGGASSGFPSSSVILVPVLAALLLLVAAVLVSRRRPDEDYSRDEATGSVMGEVGQTQLDERTGTEQPSATSPSVTCPECGAPVKLEGAVYCFNCGASLGGNSQQISAQVAEKERQVLDETCMVCRLRIRVGEKTLRCPYCGKVAHRDHLLEWIHVKDFCPICRRRLDEEHLQR